MSPRSIPRRSLVLGAGLAAAHALAAVGQKVLLIDKESRLGGAPIISGYAKLVPSGEWAKDAIGGMVSRVEGNALVSIHKGKKIERFEGEPGDFRATLSDGTTVEAGAAILCTGFTHFDSVNKPEWGFGTFPDVVTTTQVEQMISTGRGIRCPSDGRKPQRVAILLCVGSRDRQIGREWCSKICCTVSCNIAMEIREELPDCHVYIYYMDIRTYGLNETYYWKSQEEFKVKYIKARIAEVTSDGEKLIVKGEDTLVKRPITIPFDMVVHAIGMDPNLDNKSIAGVFGVALQEHGHIGKGSVYGSLGETSRPGVFVAGDVRSESAKRVAAAVGEGAVEDRLAVFGLADLQIGRVAPAFDEIALAVDQDQAAHQAHGAQRHNERWQSPLRDQQAVEGACQHAAAQPGHDEVHDAEEEARGHEGAGKA